MPDTTTGDTPQAGGSSDTSPQAGATTSSTPQAGSGTKTPEDYERMIADLRKENAAHRTKLNKFEQDELARQQAAMGDLEKAQARADKAEKQIQQYRDQLVLAQVTTAALKKGIIDPDLAALAVKGSLEFGDDGMPTNLDKALDDLIKSKPYLVPQQAGQQPASAAQTAGMRQPPQTPANNPGRGQIVQPGQLPPKQVVRMTDVFRGKQQ